MTMIQAMAVKALPPLELLRQLLRYEPETGKLFWLPRPASMFSDERQAKVWNTNFAGLEAFTYVNDKGYRTGTLLRKDVYAHRVAFALHTGSAPSGEIDHINGDRSDNRACNLRECDRTVNTRNRAMPRNNTSGFIGIRKVGTRWRAEIGKRRFLGSFGSLEEAVRARRSAEEEIGYHQNHGRGE